jgi:thymidylate synthase (FAD)
MDKDTHFPLNDALGFVALIDHLGNDLSVVNAARVSYGKRSEQFTEKDAKLIAYLMRNRHGTPFEHIVYQFRVRAPLFVVAQWQRHRMGSYNEESGRYVELRPDFYVPRDVGRPAIMESANAEAYATYEALLAEGELFEDARMVLPQSIYKEFWWTVNARSLMNFLMTRNEAHAQKEIRAYAEALEKMFNEVTPHVAKAFVDNGRVAP